MSFFSLATAWTWTRKCCCCFCSCSCTFLVQICKQSVCLRAMWDVLLPTNLKLPKSSDAFNVLVPWNWRGYYLKPSLWQHEIFMLYQIRDTFQNTFICVCVTVHLLKSSSSSSYDDVFKISNYTYLAIA